MSNSSKKVIFRRYRTGKDGKVYDAFHYGLKAWPISIPADEKDESRQKGGQ